MTSSIPWQQRLSTGTEDIQDEVIRWYQQTRYGKSYVPDMIWGTLQTEAYATVILSRVVAFLGVPDEYPGVAKRMERQQVLYDGEHHYDVILGEQAMYANVGGPKVMSEQLERLLRDIDLPSLRLGIVPATAEMSMVPKPSFSLYDGGRPLRARLLQRGHHRPCRTRSSSPGIRRHQRGSPLRRRRQGAGQQGPGVLEQHVGEGDRVR